MKTVVFSWGKYATVFVGFADDGCGRGARTYFARWERYDSVITDQGDHARPAHTCW